MQKKLKIIITGFDVFGTLTYNPSKIIINFINEYIINKKKESNTKCNQEIDTCVDFFLKNHHFLKDINNNSLADVVIENIVFPENLSYQNEKKEREIHNKKKDEGIDNEKLEVFNIDEIKKCLTTLACFDKSNFEFVKCELCLVNKEAVDEMIQKIYKELLKEKEQEENNKNEKEKEKERTKNSTDKVIIIHMGVSASSYSITLESMATNLLIENLTESAKFKDVNDLPCDYIETTLNVQKIVHQVNEKSNLKVEMSCDCGTYFCNYIYYQSLKKVRKYSIPVLFIHLPLFENVHFSNQVECIKHILSCIYEEMY